MASTDLRVFLEDRLKALDPTVDLTVGSPAQTQFIGPVLTRLGTDPFETDIDSFLLDRFKQEFPDIYAGDPSVVRDIFVKPLILFLEPFKREIETIKRNQSLSDPTVLSDEDADALAANVFDERDTGGFATGVARLYFANPTNSQVEITNRFFTADGLNFFATNPVSITAEEMIFNRSGSLFYFDVPIKAEEAGDDYNITADQLNGVEGVFGVLKVTNIRDFTNGSPRQDTPTFIASASTALTERSLVSRRGATARIKTVFKNDIKAVQVIGAKDEEMQRDILVAAGPGHAWLTGIVNLYDKIAYVQIHTIDGEEDDAPVVDDKMFIYLDKYVESGAYSSLAQDKRFIQFNVEEVLAGPLAEATPYQISYVVRISGEPPAGVTIPTDLIVKGGFLKKGTVRISSLPDIGEVSLTVDNADVHVYGHTDIYVRPALQESSTAVLAGVTDSDPLIERSTMATNGAAGSDKHVVQDAGIDFEANGVQPGDILSIESGDDVGYYTIAKVSTTYLFLTSNLTSSQTSIKYRVSRYITIDPFEPKNLKFPFASATANDLSTVIGTKTLTLDTNDLLAYSVRVGDKIKITSGLDMGTYTITSFDSTLGGRGPVVDVAMSATDTDLTYEVYTALDPVELPLIRIKSIKLLDSAKQPTGITIPPADPVAVVPEADFNSAAVRGSSAKKSGYVLPGTSGYVSNNVANGTGTGDRRYSLGFDTPDGVYKWVTFPDGADSEFDFKNSSSTDCNYFVAISEGDDTDLENYPPIDPKAGECLRIKSGPNAGSYLIKNVTKFRHTNSDSKGVWSYFIEIYGTFPVDIFRQLITFLDAAQTAGAAGAGVTNDGGNVHYTYTLSSGVAAVTYPTFFETVYDSLGDKLRIALTYYGATIPGATTPDKAAFCQAIIDDLTEADYEWGDPARGVLRTYFIEPTLVEINTSESATPTLFKYTNAAGEELLFRPDPNKYAKQQIVPPMLTEEETLPTEFNRDLSTSGTTMTFTDSANTSMFKAKVEEGDILAIHEETQPYSSKSRLVAVQTTLGSTTLTAPTSAGTPFNESMVGSLLSIEEGEDEGIYTIIEVTDSNNIVIDHVASETTPDIILQGSGANWGWSGSNNVVTAASGVFVAGHVGKYLTLYGMDNLYMGSFEILSLFGADTAEVDRTGMANFPAIPADAALGRWVITDAPVDAPTIVDNATELVALRPIRIYERIATEYTITAIDDTTPDTSVLTIDTACKDGGSQPYRILRENVRIITPTALKESTDGPYYYFETQVVSLDPNTSSNLEDTVYLEMEEGTYASVGYNFQVNDSTLSYSMDETGYIELPTSILPVDSENDSANLVSLLGSQIEIEYEKAEAVSLLQDFVDSAQDRVTSANILARHFLPSYVSYDATYSGGSSTNVIGQDIIEYVNGLTVEDPIDVSTLEEKIVRRGGNLAASTRALSLTYDLDRKPWLSISKTELGGNEEKPPFNGTSRIMYFIVGPDESTTETEVVGERIKLVRE